MEKFNSIIAGKKIFESFATPSELNELKENLQATLNELKANLTEIVEQGNEGVKVNDNNNRDSIFDKIEESLQDLKDWSEVGICDPITDAIKDFLLETTNKKIDSNHSLLINETKEIIDRLDDLQTFVVDVLGDKIDALATSQAQGFSKINDSIVVTQNDVADVAVKVDGVGTKVTEVNGKLDDVLVGKDALKQAISEKIGREASNRLVGMAEDVESLQHLEPMWQNIGYSEAPRSLKDELAYAKIVKDNWESDGYDHKVFTPSDPNLVFLPNVELKQFNTTTFKLQGCTNLRYVSGDIDLSTITNFSNTFTNLQNIFYLPALNTENGTTFNSFLLSCFKLKRIEQLDFASATSVTYFGNDCPDLEYVVIKNLGNAMTNVDLSRTLNWGTVGSESKKSLRRTLVELTPTKTVATTVKLSANTFAVYETFGEEDKEIIEDKGFTITK